MRRMMIILAALAAAICMMTTAVSAEGAVTGGWKPAENPAVTEELKAVFDKGLEKLVGMNYVPVSYLGSQVVSGTNHAFLCQGTAVAPGAAPSWKIVFLYENLQGDVSLLNIADFDFGALCTYGAPKEDAQESRAE